MENLLLKYFQQRMEREQPVMEVNEPGPVITISREYGCLGKIVAKKLTQRINSVYNTDWKWLSKEIFEKLADDLKLNPSVIEEINNFHDRGVSDYLALLLSKSYYPGERKIKNTLHDIILSLANEGKVVMVGRAGYYITNHIQNSYHIRLHAPLDWRVEHISKKRGISYQDSMKFVEDMDEKRLRFMEYFHEERKENKPFNQEINCAYKSVDAIVEELITDIGRRLF
jgi:cytidylate kinase